MNGRMTAHKKIKKNKLKGKLTNYATFKVA